MIYRILLYCLGAFLLALGISFTIVYLSLFSLGFTFEQYLGYMFGNGTFYLLPAGMLILCAAMFFDEKWERFIQRRKDRRRS